VIICGCSFFFQAMSFHLLVYVIKTIHKIWIIVGWQAREKTMQHPNITADPQIMMGKPCIKGTRITVELILRKLGAGRTFKDILEAYPQLSEEDLRAALAFAADYMQHETIIAAE